MLQFWKAEITQFKKITDFNNKTRSSGATWSDIHNHIVGTPEKEEKMKEAEKLYEAIITLKIP